ncbi:MAG: outer membrane lipoprotein carrier protein LolA [Prevotellaceae bacterium]|jgi:outer membrane lipoprotein-sorting protein|nr:outer membrane lipoprotein carrier protein LolA [Prevotellaceae bacterium]
MKRIFTLLFVSAACVAAHAQTISDADRATLQKIKEANRAYTSITSPFKQTQHLVMLGENTSSAGMFYYRKPAYLSMKYTQPAGDLLLIDGNRFKLVVAGKEKKVSSKNAKMEGMKTILSACLQGDVEQLNATKITCSKQAQDDVIVADINGKVNKSGVSRVIVRYDKTDYSPVSIQTIEPDGSYTLYELTGRIMNSEQPQ